ncbi:bacteriocin biosynthesis protein SagD [Halobacteriales archaeon QS_1_68_20]|nr:MAG: bacteriocin biosynthesis protein SagD [Halobacteriales archaeon QS_1_68_20]
MQFVERDTVIDPKYAQLLGQRTGLVNGLYATLETREAPAGAISQPVTCSVGYMAGTHGDLDLSAGGKGREIEQSFMSSIGEFVERYCMCFPPEEDELVEATYEEMAASERTVDYEYLAIYDEQTTEERLDDFDRETEIYWTSGQNLLTGEEVWVPAELVWLNVGPMEHQEHFIGTSNGTAAGSSLQSALLGSILEAVERDGFMRTWCLQESPDRVRFEDFPEVDDVLADIENDFMDADAFFYDSPLSIPQIGAVATRDDGGLPAFILGGAAHPDAAYAIEHALVETIQGWPFVAEISIDMGFEDLRPDDPHDNFEGNVLYYSLPENVDDVEFLMEGDRAELPGPDTDGWDVEDHYEYCLKELDDAGMTPIAFDLTTRDMLETDFRVTKVYIPELVPLTPPFSLPTNHPVFEGQETTDKPHPYP